MHAFACACVLACACCRPIFIASPVALLPAMAHAHHMRAEGQLHVKLGEHTEKAMWVVIDGYVLRIFPKEPAGHLSHSLAALSPVDEL